MTKVEKKNEDLRKDIEKIRKKQNRKDDDVRKHTLKMKMEGRRERR